MVTFGLSKETIGKINGIFHKYPVIERILIYGCRAKGTFCPSSDIDLTLMGDQIDLSIQYAIENDLDDLLLPYKFDLSVFKKIDNPDFIEHINRVGKEFYLRRHDEYGGNQIRFAGITR
ncbi:hypothetical protein C7T94_11260 [Pedobacter yulinensis]|uniref:Polymerase beta nucleotidyltransferase domain-containing protein n=1 Tax=Pedobacter yulinensis TaxID=2126353 RepID=A0A2T3HL56_9SPHI|nr:nucleotidyltransferase domain-containing protein [Pedobacter yulinensis]PST83170.1 hypothetical protein C7T94_11260 [Pedobacter yulinensis]